MYLEVAVAAPLEQTLTYNLSDKLGPNGALQPSELVGMRALVPLGRRKVTGYILTVHSRYEVEYAVRDVVEILDKTPLFHQQMIPFFRWVARYYHYPIGEVIKTALPAGLSPRSVKRILLTEKGKRALAGAEHRLAKYVPQQLKQKGRLDIVETREWLRAKSGRSQVDALVAEGLLHIDESLSTDTVKEKYEVCYRLLDGLHTVSINQEDSPSQPSFFSRYREQLAAATDHDFLLSEAKTLYHLHNLAQQTGNEYVPRKELFKAYPGAAKAIATLQEKKIADRQQRRVYRNPLGDQLDFLPRPDELTKQQKEVLTHLRPAIESKQFQPFLLHGVTGSGKTEVYLQAAEQTLALGRDVLVLVPEIALATQLEAHFFSRFGDRVVLMHSGLSAAERYDQWRLAYSRRPSIVIGARSAIFSPLCDPGLIVVDEEHDSGFKQDDNLRYNGRDLAVVRGKMQESVVLLASATPSITSYYNALQGKYRLLTMAKRVGERELPQVSMIDISKQVPGKKKGLFHPILLKALTATLERGKQSVILLNRRGFSTTVLCQQCGAPVECANCRVSLTLHQSKKQLLCHYCGYGVHHQTVCNSCGSMSLVPVGFGTERVEHELTNCFPAARIARLDTDTSADRKKFVQILREMRAGEIDILVGTQMVAKGHHFPGVTLVGVVWADGGLSMPDYRAAEKTFQLVTQVTGRAGRGDDPGEVFIQTMRPDHYALRFAQNHQYDAMLEQELAVRKNPAFPPYVRLIAFHLQAEKETAVKTCAIRLATTCRQTSWVQERQIEVLGPAPAPIERLKKNFRWQVLCKSANVETLHQLCVFIQRERQELLTGGCRLIIDVDPENLM